MDVKAGEYLLAVRGKELQAADQHLQPLREHRRTSPIEITVGPNADGSGSRTMTVEPLAS